MKFFLLGIFLLVDGYASAASPKNISSYFDDEDACFLLYDLRRSETLTQYQPDRCAQRVPACSTFKVALAVIAFDKDLLQDENTPFKWDGTDYGMQGWNHDQTAASWMKESAVWVSQRLTTQLGRETVEKYLKDFGYGTADLSGGIETAWLTVGTPGKPVTKTTLLISPQEQVKFLTRLWKEELPVSKRAMQLTKKLLVTEKSPQGYELQGKTGSGFMGENRASRLGWFVAHLSRGEEEYLSVVRFTSSKKTDGNRYGGFEAREKMKRILTDAGKF